MDPLAEQTFDSYGYCYQNPIIYIDPDGREIEGVTKEDAQRFHDDLNTIFGDKKFESFRSLITRGKNNNNRKFDKIDKDSFEAATKDLSGDDLIAAQAFFGQINSDDEHKVEYVAENGFMSSQGFSAYKEYMSKMLRNI